MLATTEIIIIILIMEQNSQVCKYTLYYFLIIILLIAKITVGKGKLPFVSQATKQSTCLLATKPLGNLWIGRWCAITRTVQVNPEFVVGRT